MLQMTQQQADRNLLELADLLDQVQAKHGHFDMQRWVRVGVGVGVGEQQSACCTPSCAAGWWTQHRYGLEDWPQDNSARSNARYFSNIIQRDFGIGPDSAEFARLFGAHPHRSAADEAQAIRAFVYERQSMRSARVGAVSD